MQATAHPTANVEAYWTKDGVLITWEVDGEQMSTCLLPGYVHWLLDAISDMDRDRDGLLCLSAVLGLPLESAIDIYKVMRG